MKKFYLGALGCLLAMGASAQKVEQVGIMQDELWSLYSIPKEYAYDGKSSVYTINEAESTVEFTVYNKSFAVDRTIKVDNPTSYYRTVVESRDTVMIQNGEGSLEVGYRTLEEIKSGNSYLAESKSYPHWWAVNKCTNTTYTDEYVDEYVEVKGYYELVEKKEYDGGTLFVLNNTNSWYEATDYYYFNNNKLYYAYYNTESGVLTVNEEIAEYYDFYNTQLAVFTQEDIIEYINQGPWLIVRTENGSMDFSNYLVDSTAVEDNGNTIVFYTDISKIWSYKGLKFVWKKDIETLTAIGTSYKQSFTGEWEQELKEDSYSEENEWLWDADMYPFCVGELMGELDGGIFATQTLFNNDEKWEFLRPVYTEVISNTRERDRDSDGEVDYREITYTDQIKAYEIVSENGNVLSTIPVSEGDYCYPVIVKWDGETFFGISVEDRIEQDGDYYYEEYTVIYSIDKNASSVKKIASTPAMRVSPALAERNSTVNVTLDAETVKNGGELIITDSNGRTVGRSHVEAGQTSVPVTTDRMGSGVYNITLTEKGQKVENARIIVK